MGWVESKTKAVEDICGRLGQLDYPDQITALLFFCNKLSDAEMQEIQHIVKKEKIFRPEGLTYQWAGEIIQKWQITKKTEIFEKTAKGGSDDIDMNSISTNIKK